MPLLPGRIYFISLSSSSSVALQPRSGLGLPCGFHDSYSTMWVISSTINLVLHTLIQPSERSSSNYQRLLWRSRESRVRNGPWILLTSTYRACRVLLHAVNVRHGTDGFTSPPKEGVLWILSPLKSIVLGRLGSSGKHTNQYTTEGDSYLTITFKI
jgi:hypothetical protein